MKKVVFLFIALILLPLVSAEYSLDASATKRSINLGEKITISGSVKEDAFAFSDGYVLLEFRKNETIVYKLPSLLSNGEFRVTQVFEKDGEGNYLEPGEYQTSIILQDFYGNELKVFDNVMSILVSKELVITGSLNANQVNPGEALRVSGNVKQYYGGILPQGTIQLEADGSTYDILIENGLFSFTFYTKSDSKSGKHEAILSIKDDHGNSGLQKLSFNVNAIPTTIQGNLEGDSYKPEETLTLEPKLYDQAGDPLERELDILIKQPNGEIEFNKKMLSSNAFTYSLPQYAVPGLWSIVVSYGDLKEESGFEVVSVKDISIEMDGQTLIVNNIGNVYYGDDLEIFLKGDKEYALNKKTGLNPGQSIPVELYKDVQDGVYEISASGFVFPNVEIIDTRKITEKGSDYFKGVTGSFVGGSGSDTSKKPLLVLVLVLVGLAGILFIYRANAQRKTHNKREKEMMLAQKKIIEIKKEKEISPKPKYSFGVANQQDVEDYKKRVLSDISKQGDTKKSTSYDKPLERKDREGKGGMFGMFN